jgi:cysteine-rich repeat protein
LAGSRFNPGAASRRRARPRAALPARSRLRLGVFALLLLLPGSARAGTFIFADEANGVNLVTHPQPYTGTGGNLTVAVCIDPTSANASAMEIPLQNVVNTWNQLSPTTGNVLLGGANDIPSGQVDFESTLLHEMGHCIGLAHPNLASESGLPASQHDYTKSTDGSDNSFDVNDGADDVPGSSDDLRGDDVNLHWFQISDNDPFTMAATVDSVSYSRDIADLPTGHEFAANGDRDVAVLLGVPNTEAVMQQGTYSDEDQRRLTADDVATLRYGMSGIDEIQGTSDDYTLTLSYAGLTTACDIVIDFDNTQASLAACYAGGAYIAPPDHIRITTAEIFFNTGFSWFFNGDLTFCGNGSLEETEECDDGNTDPGDCCSPTCELEPDTTECRASTGACDVAESCTGTDPDCPADQVLDGVPCPDGLFCNGDEMCETGVCVPGTPPPLDDGVGCTDDSCDEVGDAVVHAPNDAHCDDNFFCNGAETCDPVLDCQPGTWVICDDGVDCTHDGCNWVANQCGHTPQHSSCSDGQFCNGEETCHALLGCQPSASPPPTGDGVTCTVDSCDEEGDVIVHVPDDALCDDGDPCTADSCDELTDCQNTPIEPCGDIRLPSTSGWGVVLLIALLAAAGALLARFSRQVA